MMKSSVSRSELTDQQVHELIKKVQALHHNKQHAQLVNYLKNTLKRQYLAFNHEIRVILRKRLSKLNNISLYNVLRQAKKEEVVQALTNVFANRR